MNLDWNHDVLIVFLHLREVEVEFWGWLLVRFFWYRRLIGISVSVGRAIWVMLAVPLYLLRVLYRGLIDLEHYELVRGVVEADSLRVEPSPAWFALVTLVDARHFPVTKFILLRGGLLLLFFLAFSIWGLGIETASPQSRRDEPTSGQSVNSQVLERLLRGLAVVL